MKMSMLSLVLLFGFVAVAQAGDLQTELMAKEKAGWTAWGNRDGVADAKDMTDDVVQIVAGGGRVSGKAAVIADVNGHNCMMRSFDFSEPQLRQITPEVVILSFRAAQDIQCGDQKMPKSILATSVYVLEKGTWKRTNYQETPVD